MKSPAVLRAGVAVALGLLVAVPVQAQTSSASQAEEPPQPQLPPLRPALPGRVADSAVGEVGQRRTREAAAAEGTTPPTARLASRVQNRVQSRLRNRIDRNYDPQANATSPFAVAEDQVRTPGRPRRR